MYSSKYFRDEKFKDTIKKNSCRLRQKSSLQINVHIKNQSKEQSNFDYKNENENKEYLNKIKTIERKTSPRNKKLLNFIKSKKLKQNEIKREENKQINDNNKKKQNEENNSSIKKRILTKIKEHKIDKLNNIVKNEYNETNNNINHTIRRKGYNDIFFNRKKMISSVDIKNIIYINKKDNKIISNTINKEEKNDEIHLNTMTNTVDMNINNKRDKKGIYSLKNINTKGFNNNYLTAKYSINYIDKTFKKENKNIFNYKIKNNDNKNNAENNHVNNNEKNEKNLFINNKEILTKYINNYQNDIIDTSSINKNNLKKDNKIINEFNNNKKESLKKSLNIKDKNNNNINEKKKNNGIIMVHKKDSYFNRRYKYKFIQKQEEEKTNNNNDNIQKNKILNKTSLKPQKKISYYREVISKRYSETNSKKKIKEIKTPIKLLENKSPSRIEYKYNLTTLEEKDENRKNDSQYLSNEKPKIISKSSFIKNLLINTGNNTEEKKNRSRIIRNNLKYTKEDNIYINNNNISNNNELINRSRMGISELLKSDKKKNFEKKIIENNPNDNLSKYNYDYVIKMINEAIQLKNSIEIQSLFSILIINFNNKYFFSFDYNNFPKDIPNFSECYKYYSIIIIPLIFLHKDENIYKNSSSEAKIILENFIYTTIENIGKENLSFKKIDTFIDEYKKNFNNNEIMSMEECCSELNRIIFKNYKEYTPLKKAIEQLLSLAKNETMEKIINRINDTILYCFNHKQKNSFYLLEQKIGNRKKSSYRLNQLSDKDINKSISTPTTPFIRSTMKKDFCLVLDIDETIVHTMNLPFGNYFLLRPGVINFLEELSKLFEIVIFTCSPKNYADNILNKIDIDNNYISHRLYKDHVIFEKGKSVKKLNMIGRDLNKIIFVDNMKSNAKYNLQNLCHVSTWIYDINDEEIINLKLKLKYIATNNKYKDDIRKGLE